MTIFLTLSIVKLMLLAKHHATEYGPAMTNRSASPPAGSRITCISFICRHNQGQWNETSSAFSPCFVFSLFESCKAHAERDKRDTAC